jgi:hypothetical protein
LKTTTGFLFERKGYNTSWVFLSIEKGGEEKKEKIVKTFCAANTLPADNECGETERGERNFCEANRASKIIEHA